MCSVSILKGSYHLLLYTQTLTVPVLPDSSKTEFEQQEVLKIDWSLSSPCYNKYFKKKKKLECPLQHFFSIDNWNKGQCDVSNLLWRFQYVHVSNFTFCCRAYIVQISTVNIWNDFFVCINMNLQQNWRDVENWYLIGRKPVGEQKLYNLAVCYKRIHRFI